MVPRPRTYGTRRSHAKAADELVNGTTADEPEPKPRKVDVVSARIWTGQGQDLDALQKEEKQGTPSQGLGKEDESVSGIPVGERAALSQISNVEDISIPVSPATSSLKDRRMSVQDMLPPEKSVKESGSRRKSVRRLLNGSGILKDQNTTSIMEPISINHINPSQAEATCRPNGFTEDQQSPVGDAIDLKNTPSGLHDLPIWIAQSIRKLLDKSPLSAISEPSQKDFSSHPGQDVEMSDALDNVEDVRMTRGKERKRLQQLKGKEPANESSGKFVAGVGDMVRQRDAARIERRLKDDLNDELKQRLFGSSVMKDLSANFIERNACGKLLFNTLVDMSDSTNRDSAAALKSALNERKDDAPFHSAFQILASSSEIMAFINFFFSKDDAPHWEVPNADESRPSTGVETSGATTVTETSGPTSRAGTSISDAEGFPKVTIRNKAIDNRNPEEQNRSREIVQALEAATTILLQIQQGEVGTGYITPYFGGNIIPNPIGQPHIATHGFAYGPPHPNYASYGVTFGPPVGATFNNYASPYTNPVVSHPNTYASPYSNAVNQPPANYASPYANSVVTHKASVISPVGSSNNKADKPDSHETHRDNKEARTPHQDIVGVGTEVEKANDETAGQGISNNDENTNKASKETDDQDVSNDKVEASKAWDKVSSQGVSNKKEEASNVVNSNAAVVDDANKQNNSSKEGKASSDDDLTDDDLMIAKGDNQKITPPAKNHRLFTGERLGDFTSTENIDWLLTMSNGGKIPRPSKKARISSPSRSSSSPTDAQVQTEVSRIIDQIMLCKDWRGQPGGTPKHLFYASAEGQRLAAELRRLMAVAKPVVNTVVPLAESQARVRFYQQLESRAIREKRDREIQEGFHRLYGSPVQMQHWGPPPIGLPVVQYPTPGLPIPPTLPSNAPMKVPFIPRGNVIAPPPGGRNIEEEKKAETYGYPPMPPSRPGVSQKGQKRKRTAKH